jgi:hypothetical protein
MYFGNDDIKRKVTYPKAANWRQFDINKYWRPNSDTCAVINSFVIIQSGRYRIPIYFQFCTTMHDNRILPIIMAVMWPKNGRVNNHKWKLVFLVPKDMANAFGHQGWKPASEQGVWNRRVEQYVIGIDPNILWT